MKTTQPDVNRSRLLTLFEQLITIDSPSFGERGVCDFLMSQLAALDISAQEDDAAEALGGNCGNLYCYVEGTLPLPPLLFCAHMDTVEPSRNKQMRRDADGRITSMGNTVLGADDCAGIASILEALTIIQDQKLPHRPIELLFSVAEEPYCTGIAQFDFSKLRSREGYVFDLTGPVGSAAYQAPMILSFQAVFRGRAAHAGFSPEDGLHAIKAAAAAVSRISCGHVGNGTLNIGTINGGTANNIVPDRCTITGEIRSYSDEEALTLLQRTASVMEDAAADMGATVEISHTIHFHAYRTDLTHPAAKRFSAACEKLNLPLQFCQTFGGSDHNHLAGHGITGLVVANAMNDCHSCTEYTTEAELARAAALALTLMLSTE